jgi:hypothetical protein
MDHTIGHLFFLMKSSQKNTVKLVLYASFNLLCILVGENSLKDCPVTFKYFIKPSLRVLLCVLNVLNFDLQINFFSLLLKLSKSHSLLLYFSSLILFSPLFHYLIQLSSFLVLNHIIYIFLLIFSLFF